MKVIVLVKREEIWIEDDSDCSTRISTRSTIRIAIFMQFLHHGCNFKLWWSYGHRTKMYNVFKLLALIFTLLLYINVIEVFIYYNKKITFSNHRRKMAGRPHIYTKATLLKMFRKNI